MTKYSLIGAEEFHKAGRKQIYDSLYSLFLGIFQILHHKQGFLDGRNGYQICSMYAKSSFNKYKKAQTFEQEWLWPLILFK